MLSGPFVLVISLLYLGLLFAIASWAERRAGTRRSILAAPYVYALSMAVYCTSWTFFGSVGRAVSSGIGFLPIYLGPTLAFVLGWVVIRKIIRVAKNNNITSIADLIASRYGKSFELGILVSTIAVIGILPYISLQLKAISTSFSILIQYPYVGMPVGSETSLFRDTDLYVTLAMAAFAILFGTRHIDASERHEGMVAAIAFESVVKLAAFIAVGLFVTFGVFNGFGDIFAQAEADPRLQRLFTIDSVSGHISWLTLMLLAMAAIVVLPRQFQVLVVENVDERHLRQAMWVFPLYLLLINVFVLPIAFAGLLRLPAGAVDADTFVLTIPMQEHAPMLALLAFIGGLSAATGMIIVETVALATMVSNDLVMPLLLRIGRQHLLERRDLTGVLLAIRRGTIVLVLLLGYVYVLTIGETYALVTIGLVSFVAALQFAPPILAGIYWKGATKAGALAALSGGFLVWLYTLLLPSFAMSGWLPRSFVEAGLFGSALLKPYALLGLEGLDPISHATIWTMLANVGLLIGVSLFTNQSMVERSQAVKFVDVFRSSSGTTRAWRGRATKAELFKLLARFVGEARADAVLLRYEQEIGRTLDRSAAADSALVSFIERQLAGAIGAASARIMVASVLREEMHDIDEVTRMLDEASQLVVYSRRLEEKSSELEAATAELRIANERLKELDKLKDDFMATVSHEIRTPLTSIRSFSEILRDNPDLHPEQREEFVNIIVQESERLSRLVNDILDLAKMQAGTTDWRIEASDPRPILEQALAATSGLFAKSVDIALDVDLAKNLPTVRVDRDRLIQVVVNLISNAVKFSDKNQPRIGFRAWEEQGQLRVDVTDNGIGIAAADQARIFERFQQAGDTLTDKPEGTGLGLPITRQILRRFGGDVWVASEPGKGSVFSFRIPAAARVAAQA
ncbi:MAG TPA: ATP-binding protein [Hyphomicrobiaceae bacterium]|nr:ATP-binding protein [Hyphomicrobiaceae bacterium]